MIHQAALVAGWQAYGMEAAHRRRCKHKDSRSRLKRGMGGA